VTDHPGASDGTRAGTLPAGRDEAAPAAAARPHVFSRKNTPEAISDRQSTLRALPQWDPAHDFVWAWPRPVEQFAGLQEALTAHTVLPVSVAGPLSITMGAYALDPQGGLSETGRTTEQVYVPLAHTEGGLSASMLRGMAAVNRDGGVRTYVLRDRMTRASCFVFRSAHEALRCAEWVAAHAGAMRAWLGDPQNPLRAATIAGVPRLSRHAVLWEIDTHVVGTACHVLYRYTTGDACGPNMVTRNSHALNQEFVLPRFAADTGIRPVRLYLEANMGGDKKPSALYFIHGGHGKTVIAEATLTDETLRRVLHVTRDDLLALEQVGVHGTFAGDMQSVASTTASTIAAVFGATGQDLGMVATSSMAHQVLWPVEGGMSFSIRFSGIEVGTIGGGTALPHARAFLNLMGCAGPGAGTGSAYRLAQIIAGAALCLELSVSAAMAAAGSENFATAHTTHSGRA
jgi:hydroxymethylglutaryl-CoA reductase (NADPH)